jgi:hypothetical protein
MSTRWRLLNTGRRGNDPLSVGNPESDRCRMKRLAKCG